MSLSPHNITEMTRIGHYDILDCIGRGGMGLVYLARDTRLDRQVAIKCLRMELFEPHYRERFKREALLLAKLNHPNIVQIYDFIETPDQLALVMEYVDGQNLQTRLREHLVPMSQRMTWLTQIAQGLAVAHDSGIIHRDLKAENILINQRNTAKISDLGIAKSQDFNATITDHVAGSYASMSPEQAMGEALDFKSDLFSFGILAYQMLCGAHPFGETGNKLQLMQRIISHPPVPPTTHNPTLPPEICDLLGQLLSKNVDNRPDNTHWVASQFEKLSSLVIGTQEWSNDTELTPRQASLSQLRAEHTAAYISPNKDSTTLGAGYLHADNSYKKDWAKFIKQQKANIIVGAFFICALIGISFWLLQPKPPRYVAVIPPEINAEGMPKLQQELVNTAIYDAIQQSIIQLNDYYLIPRDEITDVNDDNETVLHATGADELITTSVQCRLETCTITLSRLLPDADNNKLRTYDTKTLDLLADNYVSVASIVQSNINSFYARKSVNLLKTVDENEYAIFLKTSQTLRHKGATPKLLDDLDASGNQLKMTAAFQTLYKEIALDLYYETRNSVFLQRLEGFLKSHQPDAENVVYLYNLHRLQIAKGEFEAAIETAEKLKSANVSQSLINELNAHTMMAKNDYQSAIDYYQKALRLKTTANNLINIANAYWYSGNTTDAKHFLNEAIALSPNQYKAHALYGLIALVEGHIETASQSFEKIIEQRPDDITNLSNLGLCYLLTQDYDEAYELFSRAANLAPGFTTLALNKADARSLAGRQEEADALYKNIVSSINEEEASIGDLRSLAQTHAHLGNFSKALTLLKIIENKDPQNIETNYTAALIHTLASNNTSAILNIETTLKNGMNKIWFSFSWFDPLCSNEAFVALMHQQGEPQRCAPLSLAN